MAKYPDINVKLVGESGNAFSIIGRVRKAMKRGGVDPAEIEKYSDEAMSGDYDNVLSTTMKYVEVS